MHTTRTAVAVMVVASVAVLTALARYPVGDAAAPSIADKGSLIIGVDGDQPGLGVKSGRTLDGFDIDVATYVAGRLGVSQEKVKFHPISAAAQDRALRTGTVDMLFTAHSITPERSRQVTFGGPFYVAHQDILVRANNESIKNVRDLGGKRLCQVAGSYSWWRVTRDLQVPARLVPARSYGECVSMLTKGRVDAVSTDDLILAGYAAATGSGITMVNAPFSNERYGVGLRKGDLRGCEEVNRILTEMYQSGAATTMLTRRFGLVGLDVTTTVPQFEGCA